VTSSDGIKTQLKIKDLCGRSTVTRQDGKKVYRVIIKHWDKVDRIEVDFGNLTIASVSFLDEAVGQLALRYTRNEFASKIKLCRITHRDKRLLNDIITSRYRQRRKKNRI